REERIHVHHADLRDGRRLDGVNQGRQIKISLLFPGVVENRRQEDVFAALQRISLDAEQTKQTRHGRVNALAQQLLVVPHIFRWYRKRLQNGDWQPGVASRCIDGEVRSITQTLYTRTIL